MVLEPFAFLCAKPVHEKPELPVHLDDGYSHEADDAQCCNTPQKPHNQHQTAEKLGTDSQKSKRGWNPQVMSEELHRAAQAVSTEPAQHQLVAMNKEENAQHESCDRERVVLVGPNKSVQHISILSVGGEQPITAQCRPTPGFKLPVANQITVLLVW